MRKQSLFHVHNLAYLVAEDVGEDLDDSHGPFEEYDQLGVHPYAIDIRKRTHYEAIQALLDGTIEQIAQHKNFNRSTETGADEVRAD